MGGNLASCNDTELLWVCIVVLGGTVQDDMVQAHKDLDDMVLGRKMAPGGMVLACRYQCGKVLGHMKVLGGKALDLDDMVLVGRALDPDDMVLVGRARKMTVDHH